LTVTDWLPIGFRTGHWFWPPESLTVTVIV